MGSAHIGVRIHSFIHSKPQTPSSASSFSFPQLTVSPSKQPTMHYPTNPADFNEAFKDHITSIWDKNAARQSSGSKWDIAHLGLFRVTAKVLSMN